MELKYLSVIDEKAEMLKGVADYIWAHPETAFTEYKSAACLKDALRSEGFTVKENLAGIETAFSGRFGSGKPVIGILGEFDALSGLSQEACLTEKKSAGQTNGHGCGHNLLGMGALGAAMAVKRFLETSGREGTVIYFGCPGEEGGSGKAFMARDGVFDELDAAVTWHPDVETGVRVKTSLANCQVLFKFNGKASHAGQHPHLGRSALDAVELMNTGVQYLREHIIDAARIHYAITDAGGFSPNVVQAHAEVLYLIRAPKNDQVKDLYERVCRIAQGAALMTDTTESHDFIKACSDTILNDTLQGDLYRRMVEIGSPEPDAEDLAYAKELTEKALADLPEADPEHPIWWEIKPFAEGDVKEAFGSTDVGDVSWVCPTVQVATATEVHGTPGHSWQVTTQGKTPLGYKMTFFAAKAMAAVAVDAICDPDLLARAKAEHRRRIGPNGYVPPIPAGVRPASMDSLHR